MKKINFLVAAVLLLFVSCKKNGGVATVRLHVNNFNVSQEEFPELRSASDVVDYTGVKAITLAFYTANGTEQYKVTQMRADATTYTAFGEFDLSLPMGSYTMVVLGYGLNDGEPAITLTGPTSATFGDYPARETFVATQTVNVTIDVLDENNQTISHKVVNNVPLQRNRMTKLVGSIFTTSGDGSFQVETEWLPETEVNF